MWTEGSNECTYINEGDGIRIKLMHTNENGETVLPDENVIKEALKTIRNCKSSIDQLMNMLKAGDFQYADGTPVEWSLSNMPIELAITPTGEILVVVLHWNPRTVYENCRGESPATARKEENGNLVSTTFALNEQSLGEELYKAIIHIDFIFACLDYKKMKIDKRTKNKPELQFKDGHYAEIKKLTNALFTSWIKDTTKYPKLKFLFGSQAVLRRVKVDCFSGSEKELNKFFKRYRSRFFSLDENALVVASHPEQFTSKELRTKIGPHRLLHATNALDKFMTIARIDYHGSAVDPCLVGIMIMNKDFTNERLKEILEESEDVINYLISNSRSTKRVMSDPTVLPQIKRYFEKNQDEFIAYLSKHYRLTNPQLGKSGISNAAWPRVAAIAASN